METHSFLFKQSFKGLNQTYVKGKLKVTFLFNYRIMGKKT